MASITDAQAVALTAASEGALLRQDIPDEPTYVDTRDGMVYSARTIQALLRRGYLHAERPLSGSRGTKRPLIATTVGREAIGLKPVPSVAPIQP